MNDHLLLVGDVLVVKVPQENRDWGYNPCPDGILVTVTGFSELAAGRTNNFGRAPGIYANRCGIDCKLPNGKTIHLGSHCVEFSDKSVEEKRSNDLKQAGGYKPEFVRDLPETPFWEGDVVLAQSRHDSKPKRVVITSIRYESLYDKRDDGSPVPAYTVSSSLVNGGWTQYMHAADLELISRGNVWKYYHGEPMTFLDLEEEANTMKSMGFTDEIRNPANGLYSWTKDEALDAIRNGVIHAFSVGGNFFGPGHHISALRFNDENLGRRVAEKTLLGFAWPENSDDQKTSTSA